MLSNLKAAHTSRAATAILMILAAASIAPEDGYAAQQVGDSTSAEEGRAEWISKVRWDGFELLDGSVIRRESYLFTGEQLSDSLIGLELARIDSLCFNSGLLGARASVDTSVSGGAVEIKITISEGSPTLIGDVTISGSEVIPREKIAGRLGVYKGEAFDPDALQYSMTSLLEDLNSSGYPYAQVWMTGFNYNPGSNTVDLTFAVYGGEESTIGSVTFEGMARTDTSLALRISRLAVGERYDEEKLERSSRYLSASGLFTGIEQPEVVRLGPGSVDVRIPVNEADRVNSIQGIFGFSKKDDGGYRTNGSVDLALGNIGGTGRDVAFRWLNDGESFQTIFFRYSERFFFSLPPDFSAEFRQDIYDTLYDYSMVGFDLRFGMRPGSDLLAGYSWDNNVPQEDETLLRSIRHRFRLGLSTIFSRRAGIDLRIEGALRKGYLVEGGESVDRQLLYWFEGHADIPVIAGQSFFARIVSNGVFSTGDVEPAETYPLGGARSLRGYRENQFRGERIAWSNLEYRFGRESRIFIFYDIGTYYRKTDNWDVKAGLGFGLRSSSKLGTVELSFGMGDRLSLEGTRIHISLIENF